MVHPLLPGEKPDWPSSSWLVAIANLLDFFTIFLPTGYLAAALCGTITEQGISLSGIPLLSVLAIVAIYFFVLNRYLGGPIWRRILRIRR